MSKHKKMIIYSIVTILLLCAFAESLFAVYEHSMHEKLNINVEINARHIQEKIVKKIAMLDTLQAMVELSDFDASKFNDWASIIYATESNIDCIQLAPDGIVSYIYPMKGNEGAIGHDLLKDNSRVNGARISIDTKDIVFIGPVDLIQNNKRAIISRKPIFQYEDGEEKFWGFATVIIDIEEMGFIDSAHREAYDYRIVGYDPDSEIEPVIYSNGDVSKYDVEYPIFVPGGTWKLQIVSKERYKLLMIHILIYIITFLIGYFYIRQYLILIRQNNDINELNNKLQCISYIDELTSVYNRRGIYNILKESIDDVNIKTSVAIMDLDDFKVINDLYGHDAGDKALIYISQWLQKILDTDTDIGRIGGDEFLCVFHNISSEKVRVLIKELEKMMCNNPFVYKGEVIDIRASIGFVEREDGETMDAMVARADKKMYKHKRLRKKNIGIQIG